MLFLAAASLTAAESPPERPDPRAILLRHYTAIGGLERLRAERHRYLEGELTLDGMQGRYRQWESHPLRFRREEDFGVIRQSEGDNGLFRWGCDTNGKIQAERDPEALKRRQLQVLLQNFDHLDPASPRFTLEWLGTATAGGEPCHLLRLSNFLNQDVETLYIGSRSFLLHRSVLQQPDMELQTEYGDFQWLAGLLRACSEQTLILPREKTLHARLTRLEILSQPPEAGFDPPARDAADWTFVPDAPHTEIPFRLNDHRIVLDVTLGGDTQPWLLDSAASMSVIDAGYAAEQGLTAAGQLKGFGFGHTFDLSFVRIPGFSTAGMDFGSQTLFAFQGLRRPGAEAPIAGILGWDFLARLVTRIDYARRTISFHDPRTYRHPGDGSVLDAPLKNRALTVPVRHADGRLHRWTLDLGAFDTAVHFPFAMQQGLLERPGIDRLSADLGGVFGEKTIRVCGLAIGGHALPPLLVNVPLAAGKGAHADGELAGNLGYSLLRRFVVTLDYPHQRVILERGADFDVPAAEDRSGLQLDRSETGGVLVALVVPYSPAARAGLLPEDRILALDGVPLDRAGGLETLQQRLGGAPGTVLRLEVERHGHRHGLDLELETLLPPCPET